MRYILFLLFMPSAYACPDWTDEMEAQFEDSIKSECKYIRCMPLDEGK